MLSRILFIMPTVASQATYDPQMGDWELRHERRDMKMGRNLDIYPKLFYLKSPIEKRFCRYFFKIETNAI